MAGNGTDREQWQSRIGFVLAAAGSAVGLGNIWKFPFVAGMNGGAAFVLFYLFSILIIGLPIMLIEFSIGRKTQRNPVGAFKSLAPEGPYFLIGALGVFTGFIILSYYSVVAGWTLAYVGEALSGTFGNFNDPSFALEVVEAKVAGMLGVAQNAVPWQSIPDSLSSWGTLHVSLENGGAVPDTLLPQIAGHQFEEFALKSAWPLITHALFMVICVAVVFKGIKSGIEKWNRILMPTLFVIIILLVIRGVTLEGSEKGLAFLFAPDFSKVMDTKVWLTALGHAFFTLSIGMGAMLTYGSYLDRNENLLKSALMIIVLDTVVALLAGTAIFTAVFAMGFEPAQGPGLVFYVLPGMFSVMPGGWFVGILFFLLLSIAAVTSGVSILEVVTAYFVDEKGWSRKKATIVFAGVIFLLGVPSALSFGILSNVKIFGMILFDFFDYLSFKYMLPIGGLLMVLFTIFRWKPSELIKELRQGNPALKVSVGISTVILILAAIFISVIFVVELMG
ncbi:MAG: sodium-dependent transporter [Calditrichaeota bacterium]|nr:sodium-dependent transporter [Calditrichota bacterium]MBT7617668.1 sodium-dependent transporter [Calditrichota bacterium]MBT7788944.1 sodium-dependent transporter [Calditrichota bacterium]